MLDWMDSMRKWGIGALGEPINNATMQGLYDPTKSILPSTLNASSAVSGMPINSDLLAGDGTGNNDSGFLGSAFGRTNPDGTKVNGWAPTALGVGQGLLGAYSAMQQYGLAKDQLEESKRQFDLNFQNQRKTLNTQLEDRQRARVASNPSAYQSVGDYMNKHGV